MRKIINVYRYSGNVFIAPNFQINDGPYNISSHIIKIEKDKLNNNLLHEGLLEALKYCVNISKGSKENFYKLFLKTSKAKTNNNLVTNAILINVSVDRDRFQFELLKGELEIKSFISFNPRVQRVVDLNNSRQKDIFGIVIHELIEEFEIRDSRNHK